jgi:hydrogenase-4 component F
VGDLTFTALTAQGAGLSRPWVLTAWVLVLVGYGTKMGLAPMHTWKPDAYGEAPGIVGAILAGGVTTVAFTAILRVRAVVGAAGEGAIANRTLLVIGLVFDAGGGLVPIRHARFQTDACLFKC